MIIRLWLNHSFECIKFTYIYQIVSFASFNQEDMIYSVMMNITALYVCPEYY